MSLWRCPEHGITGPAGCCGRAVQLHAVASAQGADEPVQNRFAGWASDLLASEVRRIAHVGGELSLVQTAKLETAADRLLALYYDALPKYVEGDPWQRCPVCEGARTVQRVVKLGAEPTRDTTHTEPCGPCRGWGIIHRETGKPPEGQPEETR